MKKLLLVAVAVFMMAGNSFAADTEKVSTVQVSAISVDEENAMEKFIAIINGYTKKIKAVKSKNELKSIAVEFARVMTEFEKNNKAEIEALESRLTEAQVKEYEKTMTKALADFQAALAAKQAEFGK